MIRFILILLLLFIFFILSIPIFLVEWIVGKINPRARDISCLRIVQCVFKVILFISGVKTTVIGLENIPKDEAVLFVGNHRSYFDVIISYSMMPNLTGYVSKKKLKNIPILSSWMKRLYCLFLDRSDIKQGLKTIMDAIAQAKSGTSIFIFPEGTRNIGEGILPFKEGSFKIAEKAGVKIIPVVQNNTASIFEDHLPWIKSAHTIIEFCEPIDITELTKEEKKVIGSYTKNKMLAVYEKNMKLL